MFVRKIKRHLIVNDPQLWLFCATMYYTGLRPGKELRLLRVGDLYFDTKRILVNGEHAKNGIQQYILLPDALAVLMRDYGLHTVDPSYYVWGAKGVPVIHQRAKTLLDYAID